VTTTTTLTHDEQIAYSAICIGQKHAFQIVGEGLAVTLGLEEERPALTEQEIFNRDLELARKAIAEVTA